MIDWGESYTCNWRVFEVNPETWADGAPVGGFSGLKVNEDESNDLIQTGSMSLNATAGEEFSQRYLRVAMTASTHDSSERVDVCTMLWDGASGSIERGRDSRALKGSSVLYPASRTVMPDMSYVPQRVNCVEHAAQLLRTVLKAPVTVDGQGFTLDEPFWFELDERMLTGVRRLLDAGGYTVQLTGRGEVVLMPMPTSPSIVIEPRLATNPVKYTADLSTVPNRLRVVSGSQSVTMANEDPASRVGYQSRGYWDDVVERNPTRINGETLYEYARRRLRELSVLRVPYSYQRRWVPDVHPSSIVASAMPHVRGNLVVAKQAMTCGKDGISVQEEAYSEEALWQG